MRYSLLAIGCIVAWVSLPHGSHINSGLFDAVFFGAPLGAIVFTILGVWQLVGERTKRDAEEHTEQPSNLALYIALIPVAVIVGFVLLFAYSIQHVGG